MKTTVDTQTRTIEHNGHEFRYQSSDIVNPEDFDFIYRENGGTKQRAVMIHAMGAVLAIVFSGNQFHGVSEQDALDAAVDAGKLDSRQVADLSNGDYYCVTHSTWDKHEESDELGWCEFEGVVTLGNASEPFDISELSIEIVDANLF